MGEVLVVVRIVVLGVRFVVSDGLIGKRRDKRGGRRKTVGFGKSEKGS